MAKKYKSWEAARLRRIESYNRKIQEAIASGNQVVVESLEAARNVDLAHTAEFWQRKWNELKSYAKSRGVNVKNAIRSKREFISDWMALSMDPGVKDIMREIKYGLEYDTPYKTARQMRKKVLEYRRQAKEERSRIQSEMRQYEDAGEEIPEELVQELRIQEPEDLKVRDLQKMTTKEFAEKYADQIPADYRRQRDAGLTSREAGDWISNEWFGSP